MTTSLILRDATESDLPAILAIYNHAVAETTAIWNEILVDLDNRKAWYDLRQARGFPILVAEVEGRIAGCPGGDLGRQAPRRGPGALVAADDVGEGVRVPFDSH